MGSRACHPLLRTVTMKLSCNVSTWEAEILLPLLSLLACVKADDQPLLTRLRCMKAASWETDVVVHALLPGHGLHRNPGAADGEPGPLVLSSSKASF